MHWLLLFIVFLVSLTCHDGASRAHEQHSKDQNKRKSTGKKSSDHVHETVSPKSKNTKTRETSTNKQTQMPQQSRTNESVIAFTRKENLASQRFTICAVVCDEDLYIRDWIDYHLLLGFETIYLFDNSRNGSATIAYLPQHYESGRLKVTRAPGNGIQLKIYNLFVQHIGLISPVPLWTAFIDVDEYIVLRKHPTIQSFMSEVAPTGGAVAIHRVQFGSNGQLNYQKAPVLSRFTARKTAAERTTKLIVYLPDVVEVQLYHSVLRNATYTVRPNGKKINKRDTPSIEIASINHYYTKSMEEFRIKKLRGHALDTHLNTQYNSSVHSDNIMLTEFIEADAGANAVQDTFAWEFYKKGVLERSRVSS